MGVVPDLDLGEPVVAGVQDDSPAAAADVKPGDRIVSVDGQAVADWAAVLAGLRAAGGEATLNVSSEAGNRDVKLPLSDAAKAALRSVAFQPLLPLKSLSEIHKASNPLVAARWGYEDTKEQLLNVYLTLRRLVEGQVPVGNLSGPIGIFSAGTSAANRGIDWLVWFTALISANLAVVNFLPIPIVDGGLFTFLVAEKVTGRAAEPAHTSGGANRRHRTARQPVPVRDVPRHLAAVGLMPTTAGGLDVIHLLRPGRTGVNLVDKPVERDAVEHFVGGVSQPLVNEKRGDFAGRVVGRGVGVAGTETAFEATNDVADNDLPRRPGQPVPAAAADFAFEEAASFKGQKDRFQKFVRQFFVLRQVTRLYEMRRPQSGQLHHRPEAVLGSFGQSHLSLLLN